ncbi:MAG: hypothetical protein ABEK00_01480 [Candidatus Nanohaloarchaea archaeon]
MSVLDRLKDWLGEQEVELEDVENADQVFRENHGRELEKVEKRSERFREDVKSAVENLRSDLEEVRDFDDFKDRAIVEDNIENFADRRVRLLEGLQVSEDVEKLHSDLDEMLEEFNSMSQKQRAVLDETGVADEFSSSLKELNGIRDSIEEFLQRDYSVKKDLEKIEDRLQEYEGLKEDIQSLKEEESSVEELEERLEEKRSEVDNLEDSDVYSDYMQKKEELEKAREERNEILNEIGRSMGRMERGLKKMLHEGKVSKVSSKGSEALRKIRDGEKQEILDYSSEVVEEAAEAVEKSVEGDFLGSTTRQQLLQGVSYFKKFSKKKDKLEDLQERIGLLEDRINDHDYKDRKKELEREEEELERKLEEAREELEDREQRIKELENRRKELENEIEELVGA